MSNETIQVVAFFILMGFFFFAVKGCITEHRLINTACSEPTSQACTNLTTKEEN